MNIYTGLLFNQGHLQDPALVRSLTEAPAPTPASGQVPHEAPPAAVSGRESRRRSCLWLSSLRRGRASWVDRRRVLPGDCA